MRRRSPPRARTGLYALKAKVAVRGLAGIDQRTAAAQALTRWRRDLVADLGGEARLSAQKAALVEVAVRTRLFLDHVDAWLLGQRSLIHVRRRSLIPVLRERTALADSLARTLAMLGLDRAPKQVPTLQDFLAARSGNGAAPGSTPTSDPDPSDAPDPEDTLSG